MEKFTRTHFSYNTREGSCKTCQGLGMALKINEINLIHKHLSLEAGAIDFWDQTYKDYQIESLYIAFQYYCIPIMPHNLIIDFNNGQRAILLHGVESDIVKKTFPAILPPKTVADGRFEGVFTVLWRRLSEKGGEIIGKGTLEELKSQNTSAT